MDFRITRSLLTASERSTASGITTGIIQKTKKKTNKKFSEAGAVSVGWLCHWVAIALDPASLLSQVLMMFTVLTN